MRQNIFIRMICLLLCISMLTPTVAAAAPPLQKKYPEVWVQTKNGLKTNQMAYVEQFFDHSGHLNEEGRKLKKWLDIYHRVDSDKGGDRDYSGYLMLEQEMEYQASDSGYKFLDVAKRTMNKSTEVVADFPFSLIGEVLTEHEFKKKFPNAGHKAYSYYQILSQMYLNYNGDVLEAAAEADVLLDALDEVIGEVTEVGGEYLVASSNKTSSYIISNSQKKANGSFEMYDFSDIRMENGTVLLDIPEVDVKGNIKIVPKNLKELTENCRNAGKTLILNDMSGKTNAGSLLEQGLESMASGKGVRKNVGVKNLRLEQVENLSAGVSVSKGYDNLEAQGQKAARNANEEFVESAIIKRKNSLDKMKRSVENNLIAGEISTLIDTYSYLNDYEKMTALQSCYVNALTDVTIEYYNMLIRWRNSVEGSVEAWMEQSDATEQSILDALDAMLVDIATASSKSVKDIKKVVLENTAVFTAESRNRVFVSAFETACGATKGYIGILKEKKVWSHVSKAAEEAAEKADFAKVAVKKADELADNVKNADEVRRKADKAEDAAKEAKKTAEKMKSSGDSGKVPTTLKGAAKEIGKNLLAEVACYIMNSATDSWVEFGESSSTIYGLKWSLYSMLVDDNSGVLLNYPDNPTHENACVIIEALNAMKVAKYMGEDLVLEYYLTGLYKALDIKPGSSIHTILWNELMINRIDEMPDILSLVTPVVVVYEEDVKISNGNETEKVTEVLGVFTEKESDQAHYGTTPLSPFSAQYRYSQYPNKHPKSFSDMYFGTWKNGGNPTQQNTSKRYKSDRAYLYSSNGVNLVITDDEFREYQEVQRKMEDLYDRFKKGSNNVTEDEEQYVNRIEWTWETRKWIEEIEMYNSNTIYY